MQNRPNSEPSDRMRPGADQSRSHLVGLLEAVSAVAAVGVFGIGALVLAGWTFDIEVFRSFEPGRISMKANTAVAFMLTGISLLFSEV